MDREWYDRNYPKYESMRKSAKADGNRLQFHLMPPAGWMNDPNGLCQFQGTCHIYFQYTPFKAGWGTKLWGHYTTEDWIHFREEEPFLFPDCVWDRDGVYSGSAFVQDGEIHYFYTGNVKLTDRPYDYVMEGREQNTIHVKSRDGFRQEEKQLVLNHADYPADMSRHVRDPKIFCREGTYYMLLGARDDKDRGCALLFRSPDLNRWSYFDRIVSAERLGYMWECPDFFELEGQGFLLACPQGVPSEEYRYQNVYQCGYFPAELDFENRNYQLGEFQELDRGFDFYAAQSFEDGKGRRILLGWMGMPDAEEFYVNPTVEDGWQHIMTIPRELSIRHGVLCQNPVRELTEWWNCSHSFEGYFEGVVESCCAFELNTAGEGLQILLAGGLRLSYSPEEKIFWMEFTDSALGAGRTLRGREVDKLERLRLLIDVSGAEVFLNEGEDVFSTRFYPKEDAFTIRIEAPNSKGTYSYHLEEA